jgi:transposase-like protein
MAKEQDKVDSNKSAIAAALPKACAGEVAAVELFEAQRWTGTGPCCPHCGSAGVYKMTDRRTGQRNRRFLWLCNDCKKQYTVRVGTVLEDSRIPLRHWAYGFWAGCASKTGVSAKQIQRMTGLTYKSALFLMHRIRFAMAQDWSGQPKLSGIVEADETCVGGKPRYTQPRPGPRTGPDKKTPVAAIVERGGKICSLVTADVTAANIGKILAGNASRKHLHRFVAESDFRRNQRRVDHGQRAAIAIRQAGGKRLRYREPIAKAASGPIPGEPF